MTCSIHLLAHYLHHLLKYVDFLGFHLSTSIAWLCRSMCFSNVYDFCPSQNSKLVYSFESLSLEPMLDNGVVYLTVLAPYSGSKDNTIR